MSVYLDHNATTPLDQRVLQAMMPFLQGPGGNASSLHRFGRMQRDAIEMARHQVAQLAGARAEQVIFTSGGTEANNLVIQGLLGQPGPALLAVGATEHHSILEPAVTISRQDTVSLHMIDVDNCGKLLNSPEENLPSLDGRRGLVSVMLANNETGVVQDISKLVSAARNKGYWCHADASQMFGKLPVNFANSGLHAMTLSAHKLYGPIGAGALIAERTLPLHPMLQGGSHEHGLRAGTENVAAIVGFGAAAELAGTEMQQRTEHNAALRDALQQKLQQLPQVEVFAADSERLPNTLQFGVRGFDGETLLMQLDRKGFAVSSGSACTSGKTEPSHVLKAMQVEDELALSAVRVSFGHNNKIQDVDAFVDALASIMGMQSGAVMMAATV